MGDLYQDLDPVVKERFALCQADKSRQRYHKEKIGCRRRYLSAKEQYSLGAPFTEKCIQLAAEQGFVHDRHAASCARQSRCASSAPRAASHVRSGPPPRSPSRHSLCRLLRSPGDRREWLPSSAMRRLSRRCRWSAWLLGVGLVAPHDALVAKAAGFALERRSIAQCIDIRSGHKRLFTGAGENEPR
jgi:hypothetical protein